MKSIFVWGRFKFIEREKKKLVEFESVDGFTLEAESSGWVKLNVSPLKVTAGDGYTYYNHHSKKMQTWSQQAVVTGKSLVAVHAR
jgi:hypothetical protein